MGVLRYAMIVGALVARGCGGSQDRAVEIVGKMVARYAEATSYVDQGRVRIGGRNARVIEFRTAFRYRSGDRRLNGRYRFEFHDLRDLSRVTVLWWHGPGALLVVNDHAVTNERSYASRSAERMSDGASRLVADLLVAYPHASLATLNDLEVDGLDEIDGDPHWRVTGRRRNRAVTLWIENGTWILRRVRSRKGWFGPTTTVDYRSVSMDGDVTDHDVRSPSRWWIAVAMTGNRIASVFDKGPAKNAGLRAGDTLVTVGGEPVASASDVARIINRGDGATISVFYLRLGLPAHVRLYPVYQY